MLVQRNVCLIGLLLSWRGEGLVEEGHNLHSRMYNEHVWLDLS